MLADPALPHQIVLRFVNNGSIGVSCNCMIHHVIPARASGSKWTRDFIEIRTRWDADEVQAVYRDHLAVVMADA